MAGVNAASDVLHDKTGKVTLGDAYDRDLAFNDKALEASDALHPAARWAGNATGVVGSAAATAIPRALQALRGVPAAADAAAQAAPRAVRLLQAARAGAKTGSALGAVGGFGQSRAGDLTGTLEDTGAGAVAGGGLGAVAPYVLSGLGDAAGWLGGKAKNAAGWLKVHSLHPTPTLGEAMADLPGGEVGVGRELLDQGIGGLTKKGTAVQLKKALQAAGAKTSGLASQYDAAGGAPLDLSNAIDNNLVHAAELHAEPTTRAAGNKLGNIVNEYRDTYSAPVDAATALGFKRTLGDEVYGAGDQLIKSGDKSVGDYGRGLGKLERGVNGELDKSLGPDFAQANLTYRRLLGASQAAERTAARAQTNHILGLLPMVAGGAGYAAHGTPAAIPAAAASWLLGKYGSQAGARALNGAGSALNFLGDLPIPRDSVQTAVTAAMTPAQERAAALIAALRRPSANAAAPTPQMLAQGDQ